MTLVLEAVCEVLRSAKKPPTGRSIVETLLKRGHGKHATYAALKLGVREGQLAVEDGPKNSKLYRLSVRVSGSVQEVSREHSTESVSECPTAFIEADTPDAPEVHWDSSSISSRVRTLRPTSNDRGS